MRKPNLSRLHRYKAGFLGINLLLIIVAYYTVKTASRSIILEDSGSEILPYIWIGSAMFMLFLVPAYQWLASKISRFSLLFTTLGLTVVSIVAFWIRLKTPTVTEAALFYGLSDVLSVVIVEQFWSLTNSEFNSKYARRWYGIIGSGGLIGGMIGGVLAVGLVNTAGIDTVDLLLVATVFILFIGVLTGGMLYSGMFDNSVGQQPDAEVSAQKTADRVANENSYLLLVAAILMLAQLVSPFIEYQFMTMVGDQYTQQNERTVYLSKIFGLISGVALLINLTVTRYLHLRFSAIGGLVVRPVFVAMGSAVFYFLPLVNVAAMVRVLDKALAYSINRASRELLYVPMSAQTVYQAKAWIDMLGFRMFKVFGSGVIILLTTRLPVPFSLSQLSIVVIAVCGIWIFAILSLRRRYRMMMAFRAAAKAQPENTIAAGASSS